jgi:TDG/mug DNA glycosylase family protein
MGKPLPDIVAPNLKVVFCGLNPGVSSAAVGHHFAGRTNRFWRVLHSAGFTPEQLEPEDGRRLLTYGLGLTTVVARPTPGGDDLDPAEFIEAAGCLARQVEALRPTCIAFLGKAAYAAMVGRREVDWGLQAERFGGATAWVLPNPSGRNLSFSLDALVTAYSALRLSADFASPPPALSVVSENPATGASRRTT